MATRGRAPRAAASTYRVESRIGPVSLRVVEVLGLVPVVVIVDVPVRPVTAQASVRGGVIPGPVRAGAAVQLVGVPVAVAAVERVVAGPAAQGVEAPAAVQKVHAVIPVE